jgi:hypothetical protein
MAGLLDYLGLDKSWYPSASSSMPQAPSTSYGVLQADAKRPELTSLEKLALGLNSLDTNAPAAPSLGGLPTFQTPQFTPAALQASQTPLGGALTPAVLPQAPQVNPFVNPPAWSPPQLAQLGFGKFFGGG